MHGYRAAVKKPNPRSRPSDRAPQNLPPVTLSEFDGVRYLHLGSIWVQGGMQIKKPQYVEIDYVQRMLASLLWLPSSQIAAVTNAGQAVQLGLGAGALTRFTAQQLRMATTVVEINPQVVQVNASHFHLPEQADLVIGDAADWLAQATPASVRLLFVDLYDHEAAGPVLDSQAFYSACRAVLEDGGLMSVNLFGRHASFRDSIDRIAAAFGTSQVWSLRPTREGNTVVVAGLNVVVPGRDELLARASYLHQRFAALGLPAKTWLRMVRPYTSSPTP